MDEQVFWELVEAAKQTGGDDSNERPAALEALLMQRPLEEVQGFQRCYEPQLVKANRWSLWGAAYVMMGGCSDDGFHYFRDWLISEGRERFESALADPDSLANEPDHDDPNLELELFGYAAVYAYEKLGGGEIYRDFEAVELGAPAGPEWEERELPGMFPRLAERYGYD